MPCLLPSPSPADIFYLINIFHWKAGDEIIRGCFGEMIKRTSIILEKIKQYLKKSPFSWVKEQ